MSFELPKLPYAMNALAPMISGETFEFHYGRHHRLYVEKLNRLVEGTPYAGFSLEKIIQHADGPLFNHAAQVWNHSFYWNCLSPFESGGGGSSLFIEQVKRDFVTMDGLKRAIRDCALSSFGSGWTWLVKNEAGRLRVISTQNADNPLRVGVIPVLTCDTWEHAYYIDYRNERAKYLEAFLKLVNLKFASQCFDHQEYSQVRPSRVHLRKVSG